MKISYMLGRENFYTINEKTLKMFFKTKSGEQTKLYIYPHLNAIITNTPSKKVKRYIYTEYSVNDPFIKKVIVWIYTHLCLNTFGLLSSKKIIFPAKITSDTLIYPCNRKFRIFDFNKNEVSVITKSGFSNNSIRNEIEFRTTAKSSDFVLPILNFTNNMYSEKIIDGIPLARLSEEQGKLKKEALEMWQSYSADTKEIIPSSQYADILQLKISRFVEKIKVCKSGVDIGKVMDVVNHCLSELKQFETGIEIIQSHGDLQAGNIWIENQTRRIFIIDWESVEKRSIWYDAAVLYDEIRKPENFDIFSKINDIKHKVVTLEEIIYRMNELCELPEDYGTADFNSFIKKLGNRKCLEC